MDGSKKTKHFLHESFTGVVVKEEEVHEFRRLSDSALKKSYDEIEQLKLKNHKQRTQIADLEDKLRRLLDGKRINIKKKSPHHKTLRTNSGKLLLFSLPNEKFTRNERDVPSSTSSEKNNVKEGISNQKVPICEGPINRPTMYFNSTSSSITPPPRNFFKEKNLKSVWKNYFQKSITGRRIPSELQHSLKNQLALIKRVKEEKMDDLKSKHKQRQIAIETLMRIVNINSETIQDLAHKRQQQDCNRLKILSERGEECRSLFKHAEQLERECHDKLKRTQDLITFLSKIEKN